MDAPKFHIKHIGINTGSGEAAEALTTRLCELFSLQRGHENDSHIFAGDLFEVMKNGNCGSKGHVALQTDDVERAVAYFEEKGIQIRPETVRKNDQGKITFVYLDLDIEGFAVHLTV